jgi:hypothetical protein
MHVSGSQRAPLQIAELVEHEQRVAAGAAKVTIVGAGFLLPVSWALAPIHIEHDHLRCPPLMYLVDPLAGQISQRGEVLGPTEPFRLEPAHLAGRSGKAGDRPVADHPAHRRVVTQSLGVVHILIAGEPAKYRLPQ